MKFENPLNTQQIVITIDAESGTYSTEYRYCHLKTAYAVLKDIIRGMEEGDMFEGMEILDESGQPLGTDDARKAITGEEDPSDD